MKKVINSLQQTHLGYTVCHLQQDCSARLSHIVLIQLNASFHTSHSLGPWQKAMARDFILRYGKNMHLDAL